MMWPKRPMTAKRAPRSTQLHEVPTGDTIEEDHRRGTQLIVNYIRDKTGGIQPVEQNGKVYLVVTDYQKMRQGVGMLLAELMRIKAEGDYDAAKALINKYSIHFNTAWRDQVVARYKALDIPNYWVGINPELELRRGPGNQGDRADQLSARHREAAVALYKDCGRMIRIAASGSLNGVASIRAGKSIVSALVQRKSDGRQSRIFVRGWSDLRMRWRIRL